MARFNRFGATYDQVVALYPGSDITDYDQGGANGQVRIEAVLDRITQLVASAVSPTCYRQMTQVEHEQPVRYATAGLTTATLGLKPIVANSLHLWLYPNTAVWDPSRYPALRTTFSGAFNQEWFYRRPTPGVLELDQAALGIALNLSTGVITNLPALNAGDRIFASYDVDVASASFAMPSLASLVVLGAGAEIGARLYDEGTGEWKLVDEYRTAFNAQMANVREGSWVPDELHALRYWQDVERSSEQVSSVRLYRG